MGLDVGRQALTVSACVAMLGCAGAPVGWGGTHRTVQANEVSVTYLYDRAVGGLDAVMRAATDHCGQYDKSPADCIEPTRCALHPDVRVPVTLAE
jgi:hypothetical protein